MNRKIVITESQLRYIIQESESFKVYLMCGIPGSGKSTWIENNLGDIPVVSRDIIRSEIGMCSDGEKVVGSRDEEQKVTQLEYSRISELCKSKTDFVIDDTNTSRYRSQLINTLRNYGAYIVGVRMNTPLDVCIKRRNGQIPADVMKNIHSRALSLSDNECDEIIDV